MQFVKVNQWLFTSSHICGDFNYSGIDWDNLSLLPASPPIVQEFIDTIQDLYLFQHIMKPTHYHPGETPNILDLVFTNEQTMINICLV